MKVPGLLFDPSSSGLGDGRAICIGNCKKSFFLIRWFNIRKVLNFGSNLKKKVLNHLPEHLLFRCIVLRRVFWHLFLDLAKVKKLSEIKPTLGKRASIYILHM